MELFSLFINLTSNSSTGQFFDSSGNSLTFLNLQFGTSSVSFRYQDSLGGQPTLTANAELGNGLPFSATQQESVAGPYKVVFGMSPPVIGPAQTSHPITVQLTDSTGMVVKATSAVTVQLSSSSKTGQFLDSSGKTLTNGRLTIPAGASSASFAYKDSQVGLPTLTASAKGFSSTTQVSVGVSLVFTTPAQNFKAGQPSQLMTVQLQDSQGKAFLAPSALVIHLSSSPGTVEFLNSPQPVSPILIIPAGSSSASFGITSLLDGKPTVTALLTAWPIPGGPSSGLQLAATQSETIRA